VFQLARFWLKVVALKNVLSMLKTFAVFQLARFLLNADADENICEHHSPHAPKRDGQAHDAATRQESSA
jgi:hypothetical protein